MSSASNQSTILVVDDDPLLSQTIAVLLRNNGYHVLLANTAKSCLEIAAKQPIAAAILDIHLPDLHGLVLSQKLREVPGGTFPILVLSGDSSMSVINSLSHAGATYFFRKPVDSKMLLERLAELIHEKPSK